MDYIRAPDFKRSKHVFMLVLFASIRNFDFYVLIELLDFLFGRAEIN